VLLGRQGAGGLEHLLGAGADAEVIGEVDPADCTGGVDKELRWTRYVVAVDAGSLVEEIVAADYLGIGVREKRVVVAGLAAEVLGLGTRIDANSYGLDP
jgi:hypothetical protein